MKGVVSMTPSLVGQERYPEKSLAALQQHYRTGAGSQQSTPGMGQSGAERCSRSWRCKLHLSKNCMDAQQAAQIFPFKNLLWGLLRSRGHSVLDLCGFAGAEMTEQGFYMSAVKNGVVLRNKKSLYYA